MLRFVIIDDTFCKKELDSFLKKQKNAVKAVLLPQQIENELIRVSNRINNTASINKKISINVKGVINIININGLMYCKSSENKTRLFFKDKNSILVYGSLKEYEKKLEKYSFIRIHQSCLINLDYVERYSNGDNYIELTDGTRILVSTRRVKYLFSELEKLYSLI